MQKTLTRSRTNKVFAGIMGGLGEFFGIDPVLIRLGYLILTVFTGFVPGLVGYFLAILIVPEAPLITPSKPVEKASDDTETV
jgi:phage shock protein C